METKSRSIRVDDEVWAQFSARKGTQNEVLRELLAGGSVQSAAAPLSSLQAAQQDRMEDAIMEVRDAVRAKQAKEQGRWQTVERPSAPAVEPATAPFSPPCKHCGVEFGSFNRFAATCPGCKEDHHVGDPRDCPVCTAGTAA